MSRFIKGLVFKTTWLGNLLKITSNQKTKQLKVSFLKNSISYPEEKSRSSFLTLYKSISKTFLQLEITLFLLQTSINGSLIAVPLIKLKSKSKILFQVLILIYNFYLQNHINKF